MPSGAPISEGFRTAFREPAIVLAEIAWRWTFGVAAMALAAASFFAYLDAIPIGNLEFLTLGRQTPRLITEATASFLHGSPRLIPVAGIVLSGIFVLWVLAASVGRAATLQALLRVPSISLAPQFGLNFLRAGITLASFAAYVGAVILAGRAAAGVYNPRPGVFLVVLVLLGTAITLARSRLNWFLYLAAIAAVRASKGVFAALGEASTLCHRHLGEFARIGAVFGTIQGVLFAFASVIWLLTSSVAGQVPRAAIIVALAVFTLAFLALSDFLYIARLAAYIAVDEDDRISPPAPSSAGPTPASPAPDPPPAQLHSIYDPGFPSPDGATN
ncbi:MAG TPA: hypothetical protein VE734_01770 [Terriglobales bacterium]|jgi:hypothetical protein|nr:hypothetical protein [Terriglobales bacterium]